MTEYRRYGWVMALAALVMILAAAALAYNVGLSQGLTQVGAAANATPPYPYMWHRPWGFGFVFPLFFFLFFWAVALRGLCGRPWRSWHYGGPYGESFEEWHRRAHERMTSKE